MTTPEPPGEPTPPSFDKPEGGGSPSDSPYGVRPGTPDGSPYGTPGGGQEQNPYGSPYGSPYGDRPASPYDTPYGSPYGSAPPVEQPPGGAMPPLGGLGRRLVARIIDTVLVAVVGVPLSLIADAASSNNHNVITFVAEVVLGLLGFIYEGLMLTRAGGRTVGKMVMGIRVAMLADGAVPVGRPGWIRSGVYWLPGLLSVLCIPAIFSLLNVLWCTWDRPYRQCLHDKAAKTVVVRVV